MGREVLAQATTEKRFRGQGRGAMERCPNCGQLSRLGAKFCTICGQKLGEEEGVAIAVVEVSSAPETADDPSVDSNGSAETVSSWPAPLSTEPAAAAPAWAPPANGAVSDEPPEHEEAVNGEGWPSTWSTQGPAVWPAPPATDAEIALESSAVAPEEREPATELEAEAGNAEEDIAGETAEVVSADAEKNARARERAAQLLDELRETLATLSGENPRDFSGVISELEVAVTPPGAIGAEELSELREALLKARERPRDLDTIVDLTGRIDSLVALVIAYDRTIAAIERSLEVLRGDG